MRSLTSILNAAAGLLRPSIQHRIVVEVVRATRRAGDLGDPEEYRKRFLREKPREIFRLPTGFSEQQLEGLTVWEYLPELVAPSRTYVHLHGGAYTQVADPRQFAFVRRLADALGVRALMPAYPLAPEHTWRDSREALVRLVSSLAEKADGLVLGGDSAGGGYALSVAQGVRDAGGTAPSHLLLISPWLDLRADVAGRAEAAEDDPWLRLEYLDLYAEWWAGSAEDRDRPEVSPAAGDLTNLPPTLAFCGTRDLLHPENVALAARARGVGWDYRYVEGDGLIHVFPLLPVPEAHVAFQQAVRFLGSGFRDGPGGPPQPTQAGG